MDKPKFDREIGRVVTTGKDGESLMFEVGQDITLKKGERFFLNDFIKDLERSVDAERLSPEKARELAAKFHFVKYKVVRPAAPKK